MSSFRPLGQFSQYFLDNGQVNAGGSVIFYETDLTTLKTTYSDPALSIPNANPVLLDAAGRLSTDVWGSGVYGAVLKDGGGTTLQTLNNIQSGADPGLTIPSLLSGHFLTNDGSVLLWSALKQIPDVTGASGAVLSTDGTLVFWKSIAFPTNGITVATNGVGGITATATSGTTGAPKLMMHTGTGSCPASGSSSVSTTVTFPVSPAAFASAPAVFMLPTTNTAASAGIPVGSALSVGTTGFSAFYNNAVNVSAGGAITSPLTFYWVAIGLSA